ncbi:MAG: YhhA family cyclophane-containing RiPP [Bacteroidota bacterium]
MMNQINNQMEQLNTVQANASASVVAGNVQNAVLRRLIEEVRNEGKNFINAYDRTHSRHNRGR